MCNAFADLVFEPKVLENHRNRFQIFQFKSLLILKRLTILDLFFFLYNR